MPKYTETQEDRMRKVIRDAMAIDPLVTLRSLQSIVEKKLGRTITEKYIIKLKRKVKGELQVNGDRERYEDRIAYLRERNRIICEELFRIAFPDPNAVGDRPGVTERRKALEAIARIEASEVKLEMDLGLFTRHLGQLDVDHRMKPLDDDTRSKIVSAFKAWHKQPQMRKIEPRQTITVKATTIPNEPTKQQPSPGPATAKPAPIAQPIPRVTNAGLVPTE